MNIDWVIPCRYVEVHDNLGTIIGAGIDTFWVRQLPTPLQVAMAIRLLATADELGPDHPHIARNIIRDPRGNAISDLSAEFRAEAEAARPDWLAGILVHTVIQFEATEEGTYTFEHVVDQSSASVPLHIVHGLPPAAGGG